MAAQPGCAIHYYDPKTQTEHIWGFGHMAMKVGEPREGVRAIVNGVDTIGLGFGSVPGHGYLIAGWQSVRQVSVIDENTTVRLEWPTSDPFSMRIGSEPPRVDEHSESSARDGEQQAKEPSP